MKEEWNPAFFVVEFLFRQPGNLPVLYPYRRRLYLYLDIYIKRLLLYDPTLHYTVILILCGLRLSQEIRAEYSSSMKGY